MIDERNIEERIFEYHEDLLNPTQKEELMAYLHEHPEWQRDFAVWAQSRLHASVPEIPAFRAQLLKKTPLFPLWAKTSLFITVAASSILTWYLWPKTESAREVSVENLIHKDTTNVSAPRTVVIPALEPRETKTSVTTQLPSEKPKTIQTTEAPSNEVPLLVPQKDSLPSTPSEELISSLPELTEKPKVSPAPIHKTSTADSIAKPMEQTTVLPKKEKKKIKHKFSLKPTSDIVPTNSNF